MTDDDKGLIILLTEWDKRESKELSPRVAHHIAGHIIAMKASIEAQAAEIERLREAIIEALFELDNGYIESGIDSLREGWKRINMLLESAALGKDDG
jgi:hypothetical protein